MGLALARQPINTLVLVLDIQAGRVLPAAVNIPPAPVNHLIPGLMGLALVRQHINTLVLALDIQAGRVLPAAENIPLVNAPAAMNGKMVVVKNKSSTVPKANCITATARWLVFVLQVWASMLR